MNINSGAMAEAPREEEVVVRLASGPQIISSESIGPAGAAGGAGARGAAAGAELGRRLLLAARAGDAQLVLDLMAQGAPFTTDWLGTSPLHLAAAGGHTAAAAVLLRAGVSRDARTKVERTPLHLAAHAGHARVAALLLDHGALLDCRDMLRMTPLHWACGRGHAAAAALLARRGADPRARCKFRRTPLQLCAPPVRQAVLQALQERERAKHSEEMAVDEPAATEPKYETVQVQMPVEEKPVIKIQHKVNKPNMDTEAEQGEPAGGAAALLRQHGITLLPVDESSTVLSALQSGRTVVLSDAGKLMLKESSSPPAPPAAAAPPAPPAAPAARGVLLRATPAREPPRPGVKVFTVNKLPTKLVRPAAAAAAPAQLRKILDPQDMQMKYVQLPSEPAAAPKPAAKARAARAGSAGAGGAGGPAAAGGGAARGGVKIIMNKASFSKLIATAARAHSSGDNEPLAALGAEGEAVVCVPEQFVRSMSARYLRAQLLAAHAALAALSRELRRARAAPPPRS